MRGSRSPRAQLLPKGCHGKAHLHGCLLVAQLTTRQAPQNVRGRRDSVHPLPASGHGLEEGGVATVGGKVCRMTILCARSAHSHTVHAHTYRVGHHEARKDRPNLRARVRREQGVKELAADAVMTVSARQGSATTATQRTEVPPQTPAPD